MMMKNDKEIKMKNIFWIGILLFSMACSKETDNNSSADKIVVESYLEAGKDIKVKLSRLIPYDGSYSDPNDISIENISIQYHEQEYPLVADIEYPNTYICHDSALHIISQEVYALSIQYKDANLRAETQIPLQAIGLHLSTYNYYIDPNAGMGVPQEPLSITWSKTSQVYYQIAIEYLEETYDPIRESMDETTYDDFRCVSTEPVEGESYDLNTRKQLMFYGRYKLSLYSINQEYVDLYEKIGQNSLNLSEPLTNIENGLGIFTGLNVVTTYFNVLRM